MLVPMQAITFLGSELFVLSVLPLIYWCIERKKGARIGMAILLSVYTNLWVKTLFMVPRPYTIDPSVGLSHETTSAFPSGHSQTSITFWGVSLSILPRLAGILLFAVLPLLVGLSRVYLGVHYPLDVLAGWLLGVVFVLLFHFAGPRIEAILHTWDTRFRFLLVAVLALIMNALMPGDTMLAGAFFGSGAGFVLASKSLRFDARGTVKMKLLRYLVGIAGTFALYLGPKLILGDSFTAQEQLIRFIRYALVGFWVAYGAPRLFLSLKLVSLEG